MLALPVVFIIAFVVICVLWEVFFPPKRKLYDEEDQSWWL